MTIEIKRNAEEITLAVAGRLDSTAPGIPQLQLAEDGQLCVEVEIGIALVHQQVEQHTVLLHVGNAEVCYGVVGADAVGIVAVLDLFNGDIIERTNRHTCLLAGI